MQLTPEDRAVLSKTPMLKLAPEHIREAVLAEAVIEEAPKKATLFNEGDPATCFYIVIRGWVSIYRLSADGKRANIGLFGPGESFGEAAMFLSMRFPVNGEVVENARLARMEARAMRRVIENDPAVAFALLGSMSRHLRGLVDQIASDRLLSADQRVARFLLNLHQGDGEAAKVRLPCEKVVIASALGLTPEALSRAFASLRSVGVEVSRRDISISDIARLRKLATAGGQ